MNDFSSNSSQVGLIGPDAKITEHEAATVRAEDAIHRAAEGPPFVVFVVGPTCCGKTEAGKHLERLGFTWIEPSQYIKKQIPLDVPILTRLKMTETFFERVGRDFVARQLLAQVLDCGHSGPFVVTGCRQPIEVQLLRPQFRVLVIALHADDSTRFARCSARARSDASVDFETFLRATAWEYSIGLAKIIEGADRILMNNGPVSDLQQAIETIVTTPRQRSTW